MIAWLPARYTNIGFYMYCLDKYGENALIVKRIYQFYVSSEVFLYRQILDLTHKATVTTVFIRPAKSKIKNVIIALFVFYKNTFYKKIEA